MTGVIELGDGDTWAPVEVAPRRGISVRTRVGLMLIVAFALLSGAQPPAAPLLTVVADVDVAVSTTVLLTPSDLYVGERDGMLTDYQVPGGAKRWQTMMPYPIGELSIDARTDVLLVIAPDDVPQIGHLSALSGDGGITLWSVDQSSVVDARPGRLLIELEDPATAPVLRWIDIRSGQAVWSRAVSPGADVATGGDQNGLGPEPVLVTDVDGGAMLLDSSNGEVLATGNFGSLVSNIVLTPGPPARGAPPTASGDPIDMFGSAVLVQDRRGAAPGSLTAFDVATLAHRWEVTGDLLGVPFRCGPNVCIGSVDGLRALDPATGATRWRSSLWQYATALDPSRLVAFSIGVVATDLGGAAATVHGGQQTTGIIDATTGRTLDNFGATDVRLVTNGSGPALLASSTGLNSFALYRLDTVPAGPQLLGDVTGVDPRFCLAAGDKLACVTHQGSIRVWRVGA